MFGGTSRFAMRLGIAPRHRRPRTADSARTFYSPEDVAPALRRAPCWADALQRRRRPCVALVFGATPGRVQPASRGARENSSRRLPSTSFSSLLRRRLAGLHAAARLARIDRMVRCRPMFAVACVVLLDQRRANGRLHQGRIISVGGLFYAVVTFIALRALIDSLPRSIEGVAGAIPLCSGWWMRGSGHFVPLACITCLLRRVQEPQRLGRGAARQQSGTSGRMTRRELPVIATPPRRGASAVASRARRSCRDGPIAIGSSDGHSDTACHRHRLVVALPCSH